MAGGLPSRCPASPVRRFCVGHGDIHAMLERAWPDSNDLNGSRHPRKANSKWPGRKKNQLVSHGTIEIFSEACPGSSGSTRRGQVQVIVKLVVPVCWRSRDDSGPSDLRPPSIPLKRSWSLRHRGVEGALWRKLPPGSWPGASPPHQPHHHSPLPAPWQLTMRSKRHSDTGGTGNPSPAITNLSPSALHPALRYPSIIEHGAPTANERASFRKRRRDNSAILSTRTRPRSPRSHSLTSTSDHLHLDPPRWIIALPYTTTIPPAPRRGATPRAHRPAMIEPHSPPAQPTLPHPLLTRQPRALAVA